MNVFARALLLGVMLCGTGQPALATPPDIIDVRDELFGISRSRVFLLRTTRDNLGLHTSEQRDVVLVAIDRTTGKEALWPVYRARLVPDEGRDAAETARKIDAMTPAHAIDPYAKLREAQGYPLGPEDHLDRGRNSVRIEHGTVIVTRADGAIARRALAAILAHVSAALDQLAEVIGDYERLAPIRTRDLIGGQSFQEDACTVSDPASFDTPPIWIVRITCQERDGPTISLLVPFKSDGDAK